MLPFGALPLPVTAATSPRGAWHAPCLTHSLLLRSRTEILQDVPGLAPGTHPKASQLGPETGCSYVTGWPPGAEVREEQAKERSGALGTRGACGGPTLPGAVLLWW